MKTLFCIVFTVFLFSCPLTAQEKVKVHVLYTNSYCGGAKPSDALLEKYKKAHNLEHIQLALGDKKGILVKTDSTGHFTADLKPGKYPVYMTKEKIAKNYTNYSPDCAKMLEAKYAELVIEKGKLKYEIKLHFPCNPCEPPHP